MALNSEHSITSDEGTSTHSWIPSLQMVFDTDEKAYKFYCFYAREIGFGVRKHLVKRRSNGSVYARTFCCYKEGFCRTLKEGKKPRPDARTGCSAHIGVKLMEDGKFHVTEFNQNHNHELADKAPEIQPESSGLVVNGKTRKRKFSWPVARRLPLTSCALSNCENTDNENLVPKLDMEFEDDEEAYEFYINYAARIGFSVRKHLVKRRTSGLVYSRTYVCHKEGQSRRNIESRKDKLCLRGPKPYERTGCAASMTIKIMKNGRYRVTEFEIKHNHPLVIPSKAHLFRWRWRRGLAEWPANLIAFREGQENESKWVDGNTDSHESNKSLILSSYGDVGAIMQYMQEKQAEDPSFYYALQLDQNGSLAIIFWADAKSMVDFECFGDVLCLDTTYRLRDNDRPFLPFVGVNNHKQLISFGAALLYNESEESFKWLFETFSAAMSGKQPNAVITDRCEAMRSAVTAVWPGATHRVCVWHLYNDALKHLNFVFQGSTTFTKDFSRCMYDIENEDDFMSEWTSLLKMYDLGSNLWLSTLYEDRKKWSLAFGRQSFYADIKSSLVKESISCKLKDHSIMERKLLDFFKHYENELNDRRLAELEADFRASHSFGKMLASKMLKQAANLYTPEVFKLFQIEFEMSMDLMVYNYDHIEATYIYKVKADNCSNEHIVKFDTTDNTIVCTCRKFEFMGIQCRHVLKVLDIINIKELPAQYILKRWTKDAKVMSLRSIDDTKVKNEDSSDFGERYSRLRYICNRIAVRAAGTQESYAFIGAISNEIMDHVCHILKNTQPERH